ncbi:hypothetical protein ATANTOWER_031874 [Ataeniobius toweri]|uniref:Uncharacterized protein n=1 Tax=Ataeniobius toweri TaxID=208326 RepID=A0ABU7B664_9TELE|nr:hypothetical protein [Ataeniobius toweri]
MLSTCQLVVWVKYQEKSFPVQHDKQKHLDFATTWWNPVLWSDQTKHSRRVWHETTNKSLGKHPMLPVKIGKGEYVILWACLSSLDPWNHVRKHGLILNLKICKSLSKLKIDHCSKMLIQNICSKQH